MELKPLKTDCFVTKLPPDSENDQILVFITVIDVQMHKSHLANVNVVILTTTLLLQ